MTENKKKAMRWKSRIYKGFRTIEEFITPLGIRKQRFSDWSSGRHTPCDETVELIEKALKEAKI